MPRIFSIFKVAAAAAVLAWAGWFLYALYGPKIAIEDILPSGAVVYARLAHPAEHWQKGSASEFWKNITAIDIPKVLSRNNVPASQVKQVEHWRSRALEFFNNPLVQKFLGKEAAIAVYRHEGIDPAKDPDGAYGVLVVLRLPPSVQAAEFVSRFSSQWGDEVVHFKVKNVRLKYVRLKDLLILTAEKEPVLNDLVDVYRHQHASLKQDEDFIFARSRAYPGADGMFYFNAQALKEGPEAFKAYALSFLPGEVDKYKFIIALQPQAMDPALRRLVSCMPEENSSAGFIPSDVIAYQWSGCYDFQEIWQQFKEEAQARGLQKQLRLKIDPALFPALGQEAGGYLTDVDTLGAFPYPRFLAFVKINDRGKAEELLKKSLKNPLGLVREEEYNKVNIRYMSLPLGANTDPGYCFLGDYLLAASSRQLLKKSIDTYHDPSRSLKFDKTFAAFGMDPAQKMQSMAFLKVMELAHRLRDVLDWGNKYLSSQVTMAAVYKQEGQEQQKELDTDLAAREVEMKMAMQKLGEWKAKPTAGLSADEQEVITGSIGNLERSAQSLQDDIKTVIARKKELAENLVNYEAQAQAAKLMMFNSQQVFVPVLKGLEVIKAQGLKVFISSKAIETELMVK